MDTYQAIYILIETKKFDLAIKQIHESLSQNPEDPELISLLGYCHAQRKDFKKGEEFLKKAIGLAPNSPIPKNYLAGLYIDLKKFKKAEILLLESQKADPNQVFVYVLFAKKRLEELDYDQCIEYAKKGLSIDPESIRAKSFLALGYHYKRQNAEATEVVNDILRIDPENSAALSIKSFIESSQNNPSESLKLSVEALRKDPNNSFYKTSLARAMMARSPLSKLFESYLTFLKKNSFSFNFIVRTIQFLFLLFALSVFFLSGNYRTDVLIISLIWSKVLFSLPHNLILLARISMLFNPTGRDLVQTRPMFLSILSILFTGIGFCFLAFATINYNPTWEIIHFFTIGFLTIYISTFIYGLAKIKGVFKNILYIFFLIIPTILGLAYHLYPDQQLIIGISIPCFTLSMNKIKKLIHRI